MLPGWEGEDGEPGPPGIAASGGGVALYDAVVSTTDSGLGIYPTLAAAITAGGVSIFVKSNISAEADVTIGVGAAVRRIVGVHQRVALMPNITCDKAEVVIEQVGFSNKLLTLGAQGIQIIFCYFVGSGRITAGGASAKTIVLACTFAGCTTSPVITIGLGSGQCAIVSCVFTLCSAADLIQIDSNDCAITATRFLANSGTGYCITQTFSSAQRWQINGCLFDMTSAVSQKAIKAWLAWNISGNQFLASPSSAVAIVTLGSRQNIVSGNFFNNGNPQILAEAGPNVISANLMVTAGSTARAIKSTAGPGLVIVGNAFTPLLASYGPVVELASADSARAIFVGNNFSRLAGDQGLQKPFLGLTTETVLWANRFVPDFYAPTDKFFTYEDFGHLDPDQWVSGGSGSFTLRTGLSGGWVRLSCAVIGGHYFAKPAEMADVAAGKLSIFEAAIQSQQTVTAIYRVGLAGAWAATGNPANGVFLRRTDTATPGNWFGVCRSGGVESTVDTGIAGSTAITRLGFHRTQTGVQFIVNGVTVGAEVTTNIPAAALMQGGSNEATAAVAHDLDIGHISYGQMR